MAPIRDWTGAITISPLPYCEIAAGGFGVGICCRERGKNLYVIWWWNGKKFVTLLYRFGVAPIRKRAIKRESGENPEQTELLYASTFNPIACSLPC